MTRNRLIAAAVVVTALIALVASLALTGDESGLPEGVFFRDDFSEVAEHWSLDSYKGITTDIRDGGYTVELDRADTSAHEGVSFDFGNEHEAVTVSATATVEEATDGAAVGLTCGHAPGDGESITGLFGRYQAVIGLDGRARVVRILNDDEVVLESTAGAVDLRPGQANELRLTCDYQGEESAVRLDVNNERAIVANDPDPFETFESAGMYASTQAAGFEVVFDDLQAAEPEG